MVVGRTGYAWHPAVPTGTGPCQGASVEDQAAHPEDEASDHHPRQVQHHLHLHLFGLKFEINVFCIVFTPSNY